MSGVVTREQGGYGAAGTATISGERYPIEDPAPPLVGALGSGPSGTTGGGLTGLAFARRRRKRAA